MKVTNWTESYLSLKFKFKNPLGISSGSIKDVLTLRIKNESKVLFVSYDGISVLTENPEMHIEIPP